MSQAEVKDILLIEDDPADVYLIQRAVTDSAPYIRVWVVSRGSEALAFLRKEPPFLRAPSPALILLDLRLPECHGREVLAEMRSLTAYQTTPVIIVSWLARAAEESPCLQLGANAYVEKSTDFYTYFDRIQSIGRDWLGVECAPS